MATFTSALWSDSIGPYPYYDPDGEASVRAMVARLQRGGCPKAYAVTVGRAGQREVIK